MNKETENEAQKPDDITDQELSKPPEAAKKKSFWSSDKLLSLFAFLVSVGTFSTFAYQTYLIQKQQYASMMPYLMIEKYNDGTGEYVKRRIILANDGIGPAFIQDVKIYYKDSVYQQDPGSFFFAFVHPPDSIDASIDDGDLALGQVIPAGEEVLLIGSNDEYSAKAIYQLFYGDETTLEIIYTSVYDEVWKVTDNDPPEKIE